MNKGIFLIDSIVADSYMKLLSGSEVATTSATAIRSELFRSQNLNPSVESEEQCISIVPIRGPIQRNDLMNRNGEAACWGMDSVASHIEAAILNTNCYAIILDIESGGGYSNAVSAVIDGIIRFKKTNRKVYASVDMACSAAYQIACFCDFIFANSRSSVLGCIGTKWEGTNYSKMYAKNGMNEVSVTSDQTPNKNLEYIQAMQGNTRLLKDNLINPISQHFIDNVTQNRKIKDKNVLKGATLTAEKAIMSGLCDGICSLSELIQGIASNTISTSTNTTNTNSSTPKFSNQKPKNQHSTMSKTNPFAWFSSVMAGNTDPEINAEMMQEYTRLQNVESNFGLEKTALNSQIEALKSDVTTEKTAREAAELQIVSLQERLDKTPGAAPKAPVSAGTTEASATTTTEKDESIDLEAEEEMKLFHSQVKSGQTRHQIS